jgi:putative ABC transport system permease protein
MSDLRIVLRSLRLRLFPTLLTGGMIAVAVALLLTLLSLRESASQAFRRGTGNVHLLVSADPSPLVSVLNGMFYANAPANPVQWSKYQEIAESFPWEWAIPTQLGDSFRGSPVVATMPEFLEKVQPVSGIPFTMAAGAPFTEAWQAVAGAEAAQRHGLVVGQRIVLTHGMSGHAGAGHEHANHPVTITGILSPTGALHDTAIFTHLDTSWVLHAEDRLAAEGCDGHDHDHDHDHEHHVEIADLKDEDRLITGIYLRIPTRPGSDASASIAPQFDRLRRDTSIMVAQPAQQVSRLMAIIGGIDWIFVAMAAVVLVAGALSVMLAMVSSMDARRRQVAILRVLGATRGRVFGLVLAESAVIGLLGSCAGVAIAVAGSWGVRAALAAEVGLNIGGGVDLRAAVIVAGAATALCAAVGMVPATIAYRTPVARHLRPLG